MHHLKILSLILIVSLLTSCKGYNQETVSIKMSKRIKNTPFKNTLAPIQILDSIDSRFINYPKLDTFRFQRLYQNNLDDLFRKHVKNTTDSLKYNHINIFSGIRNDTTIIIVDSNNDYDFSNDKKIYIDKSIRDSLPDSIKHREKIPYIEHDFDTGQKYTFKVFPYFGYFSPVRDTLREKMRLVSQVNEYWYGDFELNGNKYKVAGNPNRSDGLKLLFEPIDNEFMRPTINRYFSYVHIDTVWLEDSYYTYDSSNFYNDRSLTLTRLPDGFTKENRYRMGEKISNITFVDFTPDKSGTKRIYDLLEEKDYLLIDFWGTWCAPCLELTPNLKELHAKYGDKLNLFSVALDDNFEAVKSYVEDKELDWYHTLVFAKPKSREASKTGLIKDLSIKSYPTFILVDKDHTILYRGFGGEALENIEEIIK